MKPLYRFSSLTIGRLRVPSRLFVAFALTVGVLANWLPQWSAGHPGRNIVAADTPPTPNEFTIPTPQSNTFQVSNGPDGNFWFCETRTDKIGRVTPNGLFTEFPLTPGTVPYAITGGPDGNMWFTGQGSNIIGRITLTGSITTFPIPTPSSRPFGITNGPDGNLWFTEVNGSKIGKVTPSGSFTEFPLPIPGTGPFQITPGTDGNIWFTEQIGGLIGKVALVDSFDIPTPSPTIIEYPIPTPNSFPSGITAGPDGQMWFTEYVANKIGRVSPFGVFNEYPLPAPNSFPFAILGGVDQKLYVTQQGTNTITPFNIASKAFGSPIVTSEGPSGIAGLPFVGLNQTIGFVTADANRFGRYALIANPPDCSVTLDKPFRSFDAEGKKVAIAHGNSKCKPTATSDVDWIVVDDVGFLPDTMEYNVLYHVLPNTSTNPRFGEIKIGDKYFGVNQAGANPLPPVNPTPRTIPSGGSGAKLRVTSGGGSSSTITIEAAGFTSNSIVGWNGEDRPTTLVSPTELSADISADDLKTTGDVRVTVFDPTPSGGTSPDVTITITAGPDFALGLDQSTVTAQAGTKARVQVNITRTGGFTGAVTVTPPYPSGGIKAKPPDPVTTTDTTAVFKMKVAAVAATGPHQLIFKGTDSSGRERDVTLTLVVQ